jgi:hypothetical protein
MSFITSGVAVFSMTYVPVVSATGGTVTTYSSGGKTYRVHTFTTNGTFTVTSGGSVDVLCVGGGGGGRITFEQGYVGGGGGGGQVVYQTNLSVSPGSYPATVGQGGSTNLSVSAITATSSSIFSITALPGENGKESTGNGIYVDGGTSGSGFQGGIGNGGRRGGGGGDSEAGKNWNQGAGGGNGTLISISGTSVYYGGGGGGGELFSPTPGGLGGGGKGTGAYSYVAAEVGTPNTGGGGGGGADNMDLIGNGALGGSGIVIIRYAI